MKKKQKGQTSSIRNKQLNQTVRLNGEKKKKKKLEQEQETKYIDY